MTKNLVIVESPSKSHTIEKYLGNDFKVVSSKGHIRDLSTKGKYGLGIDVENDFKPDYVTIKGKKKLIDELKKDVKASNFVYLATDPDREGEAISWHLYNALGLTNDNYKRIVFNEITKNAVLASFDKARFIDQNLVNSQETRRMLDRIIGFRLSKLMQAKTSGSSAGRVQSVALKLVVDREREIEAFRPEEYWTITAKFSEFDAELFEYNHKKMEIASETQANEVLSKLSKSFKIDSVENKERKRESKYPYITSTLQQDASNKLGMSSKKTMMIAQKLYEGIELEDETVGLISYMRTDSVRFSDEFIKSTYKFIETKYGHEYVGHVKKSKKNENVQDAHEAIRPTSINRTPESVKAYLTSDEYKLYRLIYYRALASLMKETTVLGTTIIFDNNNYQFKATGQVITFDGYLKVYKDFEDIEDKILPNLENYNSSVIASNEIVKDQHFTKPPARYTEAKLIKEMEELGIGRPSTYATIMETLRTRGYTTMEDKKFVPTPIGIEITDKLQEFFSHIINVKYTANMEENLDEIALGERDYKKTLKDFYDDFEPAVKEAFSAMEKKEAPKTGEDCPRCGSPLVVRKGKYGEFVACSNYPACKYIKVEAKKETEITPCPNCSGTIIVKKSKKGKAFYGCNNYPNCKTAYWDKPTLERCSDCGGVILEKGKKKYCSGCKKEVE
jgi:DNA topoisomerase I